MKRFIWLLFLAGAGYAVYKYWPQIQERAQAKVKPSAPATAPAEPGTPAPTDKAPPTTAPARSTTPAPVTPATPAAKPVDPVEAELALRYPLPNFQPIEKLTGNWQAIPATAFPRSIKLTAETKFTHPNGVSSSVFPAGTSVVALSGNAGKLNLAPNATSPLRATADLAATDRKAGLTAAYQQFQDRQTKRIVAQRAAAKKEMATTGANQPVLAGAPSSAEPPPAVLAKIGPKPAQAGNGPVAPMEQSVKAKQVTDFTLADVQAWTPVRFRDVDGEPYWTANVRYVARTIFGDFPTEAMAMMRQGKVEKWIYTGSGEPVP